MAIIEVQNLVKRYGDQIAVDGVSFGVEPGEIFGLLGPNGAGSIQVCGLDPRREEPELRQVLGVQLQQSKLPDKLRVGEALELYGSFYRAPADWRELTEALQLGDHIDVPFRRLSGGQKQRLSIALALLGNPKMAVLDEGHHRPGSAGAPRRLGADPPAPGTRRDHPAGNPFHGGGRAVVRPTGRDRRGFPHRDRHPGRPRRPGGRPPAPPVPALGPAGTGRADRPARGHLRRTGRQSAGGERPGGPLAGRGRWTTPSSPSPAAASTPEGALSHVRLDETHRRLNFSLGVKVNVEAELRAEFDRWERLAAAVAAGFSPGYLH